MYFVCVCKYKLHTLYLASNKNTLELKLNLSLKTETKLKLANELRKQNGNLIQGLELKKTTTKYWFII